MSEAEPQWEIDDNDLWHGRSRDLTKSNYDVGTCRYCGGSWHGLVKEFPDGSTCFGSHQDKPRTAADETIARQRMKAKWGI